MHISGALKKQDIESEKQDIEDKKQDIERIVSAGIPKNQKRTLCCFLKRSVLTAFSAERKSWSFCR